MHIMGNVDFKKNRKAASKNSKVKKFTNIPRIIKKMTHFEFIAYLEPFFEHLKDRNLEDLKKPFNKKNFNLRKELYSKLNEQLKSKMCNSFIFKEDIEFDKSNEFKDDLQLKKAPKTLYTFNQIFDKHDILKNYETDEYKMYKSKYFKQVDTNNQRKLAILQAIEERMSYYCYCYIFDLIFHELEELAKRLKNKKNRSILDIDQEIVTEYSQRLSEFFKEFGKFDQFSDHQLNYKDLFDKEHDAYNYFR